jgi:hypothetical protein
MSSFDKSNASHATDLESAQSPWNILDLDVVRELVHSDKWNHGTILACDEELGFELLSGHG